MTDVERLADMLERAGIERGRLGRIDADNLARVLLPTVDAIARQRAAEELEAVGREMRVAPTTRVPLGEIADKLDDRAAVLRATP